MAKVETSRIACEARHMCHVRSTNIGHRPGVRQSVINNNWPQSFLVLGILGIPTHTPLYPVSRADTVTDRTADTHRTRGQRKGTARITRATPHRALSGTGVATLGQGSGGQRAGRGVTLTAEPSARFGFRSRSGCATRLPLRRQSPERPRHKNKRVVLRLKR